MLILTDPDSNLVHEDLFNFIECKSVVIPLAVCIFMEQDERGQAYDGAGNMSGCVKGAAAVITAKHPLALYLHCASHCLNKAESKVTSGNKYFMDTAHAVNIVYYLLQVFTI